ncbi:MAG: hypothetical protein DHS20C05_03010 [Hyphococcus sp.]|nr:MAG: hypothetical protein DHS20C05_03010 [Marinicaulis sp.]
MRLLISAMLALFSLASTAQAEQVWLTMDQVRPYKLEVPAQNIVVGNPAIADVTVQDNKNLLLFGKSPGLTNIYIFDEKGETIQNMMIRVRSQNTDMLTFYRGASRTTYNCTTNCEATITVGDDQKTFQNVSAQVTQKFGQATGAAGSDDE